ncbi:MAG: ABC transporter ATP-binding protein [Syntrophobacteraceae bacterium]
MLLEVDSIDTYYGPCQGLFGMYLNLCRGEVIALLGRNGMGKTTTVRSIMGLTPAKSGSIRFKGEEIRRLPPYRIAQLGIALAPEKRQIFPTLTVRENLVATAANRLSRSEPWTLERVFSLFPVLSERRNHLGNQLSGGEQQMVSIGRALMTNPQLLILDEATEGLAPFVRAEIWRCLRGLKENGQSILVIDKSVQALSRIADRHYIVEKGRMVWSGTSGELQTDAALRSLYLGV